MLNRKFLSIFYSTNKNQIKFTKNHEWISFNDSSQTATIGITDYAQRSLGDIVFLELIGPNSSQEIPKENVIGVAESAKGASDIYSPITCKILEINTDVVKCPSLINKDSQGKGWLCKVKISSQASISQEKLSLMDQSAYNAYCKGNNLQ